MHQPSFFESRLDKSFEKFDKSNPGVYEQFKRYAIEAWGAGLNRYGAKAIFERIRWHMQVEKKEDYKINNNYVSRYVRKLIDELPNFKNFFETRSLKN